MNAPSFNLCCGCSGGGGGGGACVSCETGNTWRALSFDFLQQDFAPTEASIGTELQRLMTGIALIAWGNAWYMDQADDINEELALPAFDTEGTIVAYANFDDNPWFPGSESIGGSAQVCIGAGSVFCLETSSNLGVLGDCAYTNAGSGPCSYIFPALYTYGGATIGSGGVSWIKSVIYVDDTGAPCWGSANDCTSDPP